jgi:hypothetical protein
MNSLTLSGGGRTLALATRDGRLRVSVRTERKGTAILLDEAQEEQLLAYMLERHAQRTEARGG